MPNVLLTRPRLRFSGEDELHHILRSAGIVVEEISMLTFSLPTDLTELDSALTSAANGNYDSIILSSPTAVVFFEQRARELDTLDAIRSNVRFGAIGEVTARGLNEIGIEIRLPILLDDRHNIANLLSQNSLSGKRVLLLQSQIGLDWIAHVLRTIGAVPERVTLYHTNGPTPADAERLISLMQSPTPPDVVAFFSPSAVTHFANVLTKSGGDLLNKLPALASIGSTTASAIEQTFHCKPKIIATHPDQVSFGKEIAGYLRRNNV